MPCERRHVEAIQAEIRLLYRKLMDDTFVDEDVVGPLVACDAALAACDESPCGWSKDGGGYWMPGCLSELTGVCYAPHVTMLGVEKDHAWEVCPHCGRKIVEANAASDGGEGHE